MSADVIAVLLGLLVGASLGGLGGGGSTLAVPVLVFVAGLDVQAATTASLLVVGVGAAFGAVRHHRRGNVLLATGVAFGAAGLVGARIGTSINRGIDEQVLLGAFAALTLFVAIRMYRSAGQGALPATDPTAEPGIEAADHAAETAAGDVATMAPAAVDSRRRLSASSLVRLAIAATAVGLLTGLFGVGGGFAVVPALTLLLGIPANQAIGTSLVVIVINAAAALALRSGDLDLDWSLVLPFLVTVTIGVIVGTAVTADVRPDRLARIFAVMLGGVAVYTVGSIAFAA